MCVYMHIYIYIHIQTHILIHNHYTIISMCLEKSDISACAQSTILT